MCVAVVVPAGESLTEQQFRAMHRANRDSWGIGWLNKYINPQPNQPLGYLTVDKNTTGTDDAWKTYTEGLTKNHRNEHPHIVHFRIRTQGKTVRENAHPFHVLGGLLIHNGHISGGHGPAGSDDYSDTYYFAKVFNTSLPAGMTEDQKKFLGSIIGGYNKLAILHQDGTVTIINKQAGSVLPNGIWVSNTHWNNAFYNSPATN